MNSIDSLTIKSGNRMVKPFYRDEYATIELDDSVPCVTLTITGVPRYSEHYELVQQKRLELIFAEVKNYPKLHLLTDSRNAGPILEEDISFFKTSVLPEMERAGVRFLAIVMPSNKITQLTVRDMTSESKLMTIRYCDTLREARAWLRKMTIV